MTSVEKVLQQTKLLFPPLIEAGVVDVDETMVQTANKEPMTTEKPNDVGSKQKVDETNSNQGNCT